MPALSHFIAGVVCVTGNVVDESNHRVSHYVGLCQTLDHGLAKNIPE